jgi:hypothetical protein
VRNLLLLFILSVFLLSCKHDPFVYDGADTNPIDTNDPNPPIGKPCDPDSVYFQNQILPLLASNCATAGCHDAATATEGVILDSYSNIINTADVRPSDPSGSELYEVLVETDPDKRMPPPPASPLSSSQIALILKWIQQGAPNNYCDDCDTTDVKFSSHILPMMQQYCQSCHGNSVQNGGVKLTTHNDVVSAITNRNLLENIKHLSGFKAMPPGAKLPDCEIQKVEIWIDDGMPNN